MKFAARIVNHITSLLFPDPFLNSHTQPAADINLRNANRYHSRHHNLMLLLP